VEHAHVVTARAPRRPLADLWRRRGVVWSLLLREVQVRYRQAALGAAWALLQPLALMIVATAVFHDALGVPARGASYPLFVFTGLFPWTFFHAAVSGAVPSLVSNANLVRKIHFPHEALPGAVVLAAGIDLLCALGLWLAWLALSGHALAPALLCVPWLLLVLLATTLAVALAGAAVNVHYRDVKHGLPVLLQVVFFVTPVLYATASCPAWAQRALAFHPLATVVEGLRAAAFEGRLLPLGDLLAGSGVALGLLVLAYALFQRAGRHFADVV
jgi:ABC-type polysaccharide/polyol phosphate export permease